MSDTPIVVQGELHWPFLSRKNEMSNKFQVDVGQLSEAAVNALGMMGLSVKNKGDERGSFITCGSQFAIPAYNTDGQEIDGEVVGNGTKAKVAVGFFDWNFKGKEGRSPAIRRLVVTDLVKYEAETVDVDMDEAL